MSAKLTHYCDRQAYVVFKTPQAATAAKHKIEGFGEGQKYRQKFLVNYTNPYTNPFKTLPKDGPTRNGPPPNRSSSVGYNSSGSIGVTPQQAGYNPNGGYRGRGSGFNNRGTVPNMSGYTRASFQQPIPGSYQSGGVNGYQTGPVGPMPQYGSFQSRGGLMGGMRGATIGMRGGRGGMNGGGMMGMPMGGMGLGAMPMQMPQMPLNMPQMSGGMGMQGMSNHDPYTLPHHTSCTPTSSAPLLRHNVFHLPSILFMHVSHCERLLLHQSYNSQQSSHRPEKHQSNACRASNTFEAFHRQQALHYLPAFRCSGAHLPSQICCHVQHGDPQQLILYHYPFYFVEAHHTPPVVPPLESLPSADYPTYGNRFVISIRDIESIGLASESYHILLYEPRILSQYRSRYFGKPNKSGTSWIGKRLRIFI